MVFLVYQKWDDSVGHPTKVEKFKDRDDLAERLTALENQKIRDGIKYEILLVVQGIEFEMHQVRTWDFVEKQTIKLTDYIN